MANKTLFQSLRGMMIPATDALNSEQAPAYRFSSKHALAQYAMTGCLNATFYANAEVQLQTVLDQCSKVEPEFIARTAVYCREKGFMKDMPALLCAVLSQKSPELLKAVFSRVIDNSRMLRTFVQVMRSGTTGRKSLGTVPKKLVRAWLESNSDEAVFKSSVGQSPSLADIIRMVHPKPAGQTRQALYGYLIGRRHTVADLPTLVKQFEAFKMGDTPVVPDVPFQMLTALELGQPGWISIARNASWQTTRMNLNTFARHGVFLNKEVKTMVANRLRNAAAIKRSRVFPYQLMAAYRSVDRQVPNEVRDALQDAMEIAIQNVPELEGKVYICPDVSGSMRSPVTGDRGGGTSKIRCVDLAALVAAAILRQNPSAEVLPFESDVVDVSLNPRDSVMTNAEKLSNLPCGGTNCSAPLARLNRLKAEGDLVVYVSDNESWIDSPNYGRFGGGRTETIKQWVQFKQRNPQAKMVCIDVQPNTTTQAVERKDIMNIGGFSDGVFDAVAAFAAGEMGSAHWVGMIEAVNL